jgi:hypothetical protein
MTRINRADDMGGGLPVNPETEETPDKVESGKLDQNLAQNVKDFSDVKAYLSEVNLDESVQPFTLNNFQRQIARNQKPASATQMPAENYGAIENQVTGRRAAVKIGGLPQQFALNRMLDAQEAGSPFGPRPRVRKEEATPPPADANQPAVDQAGDKAKKTS